MTIPVLTAEHRYWCPNCDVTHVAVGARPTEIPFHPCRGLVGLSAPLIPVGTKAKVEAKVREDYINGEMVHTDGEGRPVMSIETTRDDGTDLAVLAPCAVADFRAGK